MIAACCLLCALKGPRVAGSVVDQLEQLIPKIERDYSMPLTWHYSPIDSADGARMDLDDRAWPMVSPGFSWKGENTNVWFRTRLVVPDRIGGQPVEGHAIRLDLGVDDDGELYVDGKLREAFQWDDGRYTLTEHAHAGQTFMLAIHGMNGPGDGQLRSSDLVSDVLPELRRYVTEARFVERLDSVSNPGEQATLAAALAASEQLVRLDDRLPVEDLRSQLTRATERLAKISTITKSADVYYTGHAHIDMNWLWTWPETIDVCHRTWNSAMNLMDEFSDFAFVQSQPGAYVPIQAQYPDEFRRMQQAQTRGQWDLVGGLWDESDTDIPSGEGLARSLFLGQRFFQKNFGKTATTGWLPDSFGHSWQLPQLFHQVGIDSFYHMRGGDGIPFAWWEAPDGSRILKANTEPYNADVNLGQLTEPWNETRRSGLPQTLVVFGVGDHGGGPTREELLKLQEFQNDPILPNVHKVGADGFFKQLAQRPLAAELPVIDHDLQYVAVGCYTTHANLKKALRTSENRLYTAEALSTLASSVGNTYPAEAIRASWAVTAFAQFHDIACGSAIHSTYEWMLNQLNPAIQTSESQTAAALHALSSSVDTHGPAKQAIVVWNPLSFPRDDVVRVKLPDVSGACKSVVDGSGKRIPVQIDEDGSLVFVARQVPGFGHAVYFPSSTPAPSDGVTVQSSSAEFTVETPKLRVRVDRATGAMSELRLNSEDWNVFGSAKDGNTLQVLGDDANAWDIHFTGEDHRLTGTDARVTLVENGPVFCRIRIERTFAASSFRQDITVYGALGRVDVPTDIGWHEHGKMAKLRLPADLPHGSVRVQIPYGSVGRPTDGQECSGQKWMDYSDEAPQRIQGATNLDLSHILNSSSTGNFDTVGAGYPPAALPSRGVHSYGVRQIPFEVYSGGGSGADNVAAGGQFIDVPAGSKGDTLFLLGSSAPSGFAGGLRFVYANNTVQSREVRINDWVVPSYHDQEVGVLFHDKSKPDGGSQPKLWIATVKVPAGDLRRIQLPNEPHIHIFAATLGTTLPDRPIRGLSVLNDGKYGFDVVDGVFRLSLLRSSHDPDPNPDEGDQHFTYSLYPHAKDWREAHSEEQGQGLNIPLQAIVTDSHTATNRVPTISIANLDGKGDVIAGALKHCEDGDGYILRLYETQDSSTHVRVTFDRPIHAEETNILEKPVAGRPLAVHENSVSLPVGHSQIVTLHITFPASPGH